jgi:plastocyanin
MGYEVGWMKKDMTTAGHSGVPSRPPRLRLLGGLAVAVLFGITVAAFGGGGSSGRSNAPAYHSAVALASMPASAAASRAPAAQCAPSGTSLQISAKNLSFDKKCLAAPANTPFTIAFKNEDALPHDVAIFTNSSATTKLFVGSYITGPKTVTYHVPPLKPGTYYFRCDNHPTLMTGTFVVK